MTAKFKGKVTWGRGGGGHSPHYWLGYAPVLKKNPSKGCVFQTNGVVDVFLKNGCIFIFHRTLGVSRNKDAINDSFSNTFQHSTSYKEISVPMTCLDCKSLLGNTRITEHNTRSICGRPKLSLIVPRNSGNRANPENDSP